MYKNVKPDETMQQIIAEVETGPSIYTKEQEQAISSILYEGISKGKNFDAIYREDISTAYPLPKGPGLVNSHIRLRELYAKQVYQYKKAVSADRDHLWDELYSKYSALFTDELAKNNTEGQKKVLDSMLKLLSASYQEKALSKAEETDSTNVTYVLDFNL